MASWKPWTLTNKGQQFQAKVNAGLVDEVNYTKFAIGDGMASSLESLTELVNKKMDLPLKSVTPQNNTVSFNTLITNTDVEEDFYCREMGLYVTDPDDGEILFAVTTDNNPDLMPADGSATTVAYDFTLVLVFSNTGNVVSFVKMDALATMQDIENHNTNADAHKNLALIINDLLAPTADKNTLVNLLSNVAYMLTQITGKDDWKAGPAASIAAILSNLQGSLAVNWDGNKFTVPALGVSGLMAQNGYVNFGKLVGGLIVQWGSGTLPTVVSTAINSPVSVSTIYSALAMDGGTGAYSLGVTINGATATVYQNARQNPDNSIVEIYFRYIIICR